MLRGPRAVPLGCARAAAGASGRRAGADLLVRAGRPPRAPPSARSTNNQIMTARLPPHHIDSTRHSADPDRVLSKPPLRDVEPRYARAFDSERRGTRTLSLLNY